MRKALDGPLGKEMEKIYESQGFKCFGYVPNGTRHISNSKYVGKLERVFFMRVILPPLDKYIRFQLANR